MHAITYPIEEEAEPNPTDNFKGTPDPASHQQTTSFVTPTQHRNEDVDNDN